MVCFRCKVKGKDMQTWNVCSDGNKNRNICKNCDIDLNLVVLKFMGFKNWKSKIKDYIENF